MMTFLQDVKLRNPSLFYFGLICLALALVFFALSKTTNIQVYGVNAWNKPLKFSLSTCLFAWSMAWYCHYLPSFNFSLFNWVVIVLLGFEIAYIAIMAGQGQTSHYNISTPFFGVMFSLMALAASVVTLYTAYVGFLFFKFDFPELSKHYLWAIRLGILIFVIFSFEGFVMGARGSHSVGIVNDNSNLFVLGWSKTVGDLRVAHFIGMHALQVIPLLSYYVFKSTKAAIAVFIFYGLLALSTFIQALQGKPLIQGKLLHPSEQREDTSNEPL